MASTINSFKGIDRMLARLINTNLNFRQFLEAIEIGSIHSKILEQLEYDEQ